MKELLSGWFGGGAENPVVKFLAENPFISGIICGIVLMLLLRFIWWLCRRKGSCRFIEVKNGSGDITVSSNAVFSVIKNAAKPVKCLRLKKMIIRKNKTGYDFLLRAVLIAGENAAPQIMDKLVGSIREQMKSVFAVENIDNIKLNISSCRVDGDGEFDDFEPEPEFVDAVEDSGSARKSTADREEKSGDPSHCE